MSTPIVISLVGVFVYLAAIALAAWRLYRLERSRSPAHHHEASR